MSIGVRCHDFGCADAFEMAQRVSNAGFESVQLVLHKAIRGCKPEYGCLSPGFCCGIKSAFENRKLEVAVLGCYIDPACADPDRRAREVKRFMEHTAYCHMLGSNIVGTETSMCLEESQREAQYRILLDSVLRMCEQAERFSTFIGIEPVFVHTINSAEMAYRLMKDVGSFNLQFILDPINMLHPSNINRQREVIDSAFQAFGDRIVAVHAKDVLPDENGQFKRCAIGTGLFDNEYFYKKLHAAKPGISVVCEEVAPAEAARDLAALRGFIASGER